MNTCFVDDMLVNSQYFVKLKAVFTRLYSTIDILEDRMPQTFPQLHEVC